MSPAAHNPLFANLDAISARATEIRHDLHRHPELGYEEKYTSQAIRNELSRLHIDHQPGWAGGTGITATIPGKNPAVRTVALRADMDALPITEETQLPYASETPGKMHACGHDGHTAILLGAAAILKQHADSFTGTVKLLFQPAEEGGCGAERMVKEGALDKVEAIFGLHGWPGLKVGMVATRPGPLLASVDGFAIRIAGKGGHAANPQDTADPIVAAAALVQSLQSIISREADANEASVFTISQFHAGTAFNIIPDHAELEGTVRALSKTRRENIIKSLERHAKHIAAAHRCEASFRYFGTTPVTANTPELATFFKETATNALGPKAFLEIPRPAMWGEDFAFYLEKIPGCFFVLGVQPHDQSTYPMLHHPKFNFNDAAIPVGIRMMVEVATKFLQKQSL